MDVGVWFAANVSKIDFVQHAERLGYRSVWLGDSQMIWSDVYACAALIAQATRAIRVGPGVAVPATRAAPVTAAAISTVNRLAPGRTFLGIGSGDSAMRLMGQPPMRLDDLATYVRVVRALLRGDEVDYEWGGRTRSIQIGMAAHGFVDLDAEIPVWIGATGPRGRELAGAVGDGLIAGPPSSAAEGDGWRADVARGAAAVGRDDASRGFPFAASRTVIVLEPGEDASSDRVIEAAGPVALARLHSLYRTTESDAAALPAPIADIWEEYRAAVDATPARVRHRRIQTGHLTYIDPDERRFITPELIRHAAVVGPPDELVERLRGFADAGVTHLVLGSAHATMYDDIERFSRRVMAKL